MFPFDLPGNIRKPSKQTFKYSLRRVSLHERKKMGEFFSVFPHGKPASCVEDFEKFSASNNIEAYNENISGKKADLLMRTLTILVVSNQSCSLNSCHQIHLWIILLVTLIELFFLVNFQIQFGNLKEKYQILTFFNYILLLLRNIMVIVTKNFFYIKD